jgi:Ca2+-binding RTX toxin-like protein
LAFGGSHIVNEANGHITGTEIGIDLLGNGSRATIISKGLINSYNQAIVDDSSGGSLKVINTGELNGALMLGDGNDLFDSHHGTFTSSVSGGDGNDTYILGKGQHVSENVGEGLDSVKSWASATLDANVDFLYLMGSANLNGHGNDLDNLIYGNAGNNHLSGGIGEDVLGGKSGNDVLSGNAGNDTFVFDKGNAVDTIEDYTDGQDTIQIGGFHAIANFAELEPHMSQHGNDVWIAFGHGDKLVVAHTALGVLDSSAFSF